MLEKSILPSPLVDGYLRFRKRRFQEEKKLFEGLAEGQHPTTMVITCADSRIYATEIFDAKPGDLFIVRNVGGLVPPYRGEGEYRSTAAALEFAVCHLQVQHIVVLGHQNCGGICAFAHPGAENTSHISAWMHQLKTLKKDMNITELEKESVRQSIKNLEDYPFIVERLKQKSLSLYGAWVSLPSIEVHVLDEDDFVSVNKK